MVILGIETSCDETAAAVIQGEKEHVTLKSNIVATSLDLHAKTGGIIPEVAARQQIRYILPVIHEAVEKANIDYKNFDAIAVTYGPGLIGSLLVGVETAKTFGYVLKKPVIPVNHMIGHIYANFIQISSLKSQFSIPEFPALALVVSGGHTDVLLLKNHGTIELIGGTRDDAAGECFDKCARLLGYQYPGGPKISHLAAKGDPHAFAFPRPMLNSQDYEFSFSGLKTAFLNATRQYFPILRTNPGEKIGWQQVAIEKLSEKEKQTLYDLCASLQRAIVDVLVKKTMRAAEQYKVKSVLLSGGVAANDLLRNQFSVLSSQCSVKLFVPTKSLCTDNGAMIAAAAYFSAKDGSDQTDWHEITANPELYF